MAEAHNTRAVPSKPLRMSQRSHAEKMQFKQDRRQRWHDIISEAHNYFREHNALTDTMQSRLQNMGYPLPRQFPPHHAWR
jgi:hypothetical protein